MRVVRYGGSRGGGEREGKRDRRGDKVVKRKEELRKVEREKNRKRKADMCVCARAPTGRGSGVKNRQMFPYFQLKYQKVDSPCSCRKDQEACGYSRITWCGLKLRLKS